MTEALAHFTELRDAIGRQLCPFPDPPPPSGLTRIAVLTSGTGEKKMPRDRATKVPNGIDFKIAHESEQGRALLAQMIAALEPYKWPAEDMYTGQQHRRLMRAVQLARSRTTRVEVSIISPAFGFLHGDAPVVPYTASFSELTRSALRRWSHSLSLKDSFTEWMQNGPKLRIVLLGEMCLEACGFSAKTAVPYPTIVLCSHLNADRLMGQPLLYPVGVGTKEAQLYHTSSVSIKGEIGGRLVHALANDKRFRGQAHYGVATAHEARTTAMRRQA